MLSLSHHSPGNSVCESQLRKTRDAIVLKPQRCQGYKCFDSGNLSFKFLVRLNFIAKRRLDNKCFFQLPRQSTTCNLQSYEASINWIISCYLQVTVKNNRILTCWITDVEDWRRSTDLITVISISICAILYVNHTHGSQLFADKFQFSENVEG